MNGLNYQASLGCGREEWVNSIMELSHSLHCQTCVSAQNVCGFSPNGTNSHNRFSHLERHKSEVKFGATVIPLSLD